MEVEFDVFTDFKQFVVFDSAADWSDLYEKWTDETVQSMFVQGVGSVDVVEESGNDRYVITLMKFDA